MPKIDAESVAAHHAHQRAALVGAARALLIETGRTPGMAAIGQRAGLARSSVYQYFSSADDLLRAVVADVFPDWSERIKARFAAATTPREQIWAYIEANVDLLIGDQHDLAEALRRVVEPDVLRGPMSDFHANLQAPLHHALRAYGEPDVVEMGELINAVIAQASRGARDHHIEGTAVTTESVATVLARIGRLLTGYLDR